MDHSLRESGHLMLITPDRVFYAGLLGRPRERCPGAFHIYVAIKGGLWLSTTEGQASYGELAANRKVYDLIRDCVEQVNRDLSRESTLVGSQIKRFLVLHKELDADDGELTRTMKVRRGLIAERYASLTQALYDGSKAADVATQVTFEDGRKGTLSARVAIRDMKTYPVPAKAMEKAA